MAAATVSGDRWVLQADRLERAAAPQATGDDLLPGWVARSATSSIATDSPPAEPFRPSTGVAAERRTPPESAGGGNSVRRWLGSRNSGGATRRAATSWCRTPPRLLGTGDLGTVERWREGSGVHHCPSIL